MHISDHRSDITGRVSTIKSQMSFVDQQQRESEGSSNWNLRLAVGGVFDGFEVLRNWPVDSSGKADHQHPNTPVMNRGRRRGQRTRGRKGSFLR